MTVPFDTLRRRVGQAVVRIHPLPAGYAHSGPGHPEAEDPAPLTWGSGFFAAPGWLLTCAHVLLQEEGGTAMGGADAAARRVGLAFDGRTAVGTVAYALYDPDAGVDIAVVRLLDDIGHSCLALADGSGTGIGAQDDGLAFFGYARETGPLKPISGVCAMRGTIGEGKDELIRLGGVDVSKGISGGPVLNLATGEVVGLITRRAADREGGLAASLLQLRGLAEADGAGDLYHRLWRAHDLHHHDHYHDRYLLDGGGRDPRGQVSWTATRTELAGEARPEAGALSPARRTRMLGLLAEMAPPECTGSVIGAVEAAGGYGWSELVPSPHTWRDGTALLRDVPGRTQLEACLLYGAAVAGQDTAEDAAPREALTRWVRDTAREDALPEWLHRDLERMHTRGEERRAERLRKEERAVRPPAAGPARERLPLVRLEVHGIHWEAGRYRWSLLGLGADGDTAFRDEDESGLCREELAERLARPLARAFRWSGAFGRPVPLEAVLPLDLFDLPLDAWTTGGGEPLGAQRPVTIRWSGRRGVPDPQWLRHEHRTRWDGAAEGPLRLHPLYDDTGRIRTTITRARLIEAGRKDVPVLCGPAEDPGPQEVLLRVLHAGYGLALWRRSPRWRYTWRTFERNARHSLASVARADNLPDELHRLRARLRAPDPDALWAKDMALLYDPPGPDLPADAEDEPLMEPL